MLHRDSNRFLALLHDARMPLLVGGGIAFAVGMLLPRWSLVQGAALAALPALLAGMLYIVRRPAILGLFLLAFFYANLDVMICHALDMPIAYLFLIACGAYLLIVLFTKESSNQLSIPIFILVALFAMGSFTTLLFPNDVLADFNTWIQAVGYGFAVFLVTFVVISTPERFERLATILTWIGVLLAVVNIIEFFDRSIINLSSVPGRSAGLQLNANASAASILACFVMSYFTRLPFLFISRIIMFIGIYTTLSRAGLVGFFFFVMYNEFVLERITPRRLMVSVTMLIAMVAIMASWTLIVEQSSNDKQVLNAYNRIVDAFQGRFDDNSTNQRMRVISINVDRFLAHPIVGGGVRSATVVETPHNQFLMVLAEQGLIGFFLYVAFLWTILKNLLQLEKGAPRRTLMSLFAFQLFNMFFTHNQFDHRFYMITFGLLCAGGQIYARKPAVSAAPTFSENTARQSPSLVLLRSSAQPAL